MNKDTNNSDIVKATAGASSAAIGGALLLKTLKTKKLTPKDEKEIVEIVKKSGKKPGEYLYRRAVKNGASRKAAKKVARKSAGNVGAGWFGSRQNVFSQSADDSANVVVRRKVFSLLQDENGDERYYSTNEFELSWNEEGEKQFSKK